MFASALLLSCLSVLVCAFRGGMTHAHTSLQELEGYLREWGHEDAGTDTDTNTFMQLQGPHDGPLPPLWSLAPSLSELAVDQDGAVLVDPWLYLHRLALYKHMVENIPHCEWDLQSSSEEHETFGSVLWGLPLQHGWQYTSGRLYISNSKLGPAISKSSWWGCMNYYLCIMPYLGAVEAGLAPRVRLMNTTETDLFCTSADSCPSLVQPWTDFFNLVADTQNQCNNTDVADTQLVRPMDADYNVTTGMDRLLRYLWDAHTKMIRYAEPLFENQLQIMSPEEQKFGSSWSNLVEYIADVRFITNVTSTDFLQRLLPLRLLLEGDEAPFISDMTRFVNRAIAAIDALGTADLATDGGVEKKFQQAMCTMEARAEGRKLITIAIWRPLYILPSLEKIRNFTHDLPCEE